MEPLELDHLSGLLDAVFVVLKDEHFETANNVLLSHLQRIICDRGPSLGDTVLIDKVADELRKRVSRARQLEHSIRTGAPLAPPSH